MLTLQNNPATITKIVNPYAPLYGESQPDEMQELNVRLWEAWKAWETYGTDQDWLKNFDEIALELKQKTCSWYETALMAYKIKLQKSWKGHYESFREFCEQFLQKSAACINNWIRSAAVLSELIARGFDVLPLSCSVALALSKHETDVADVWRDLLDRFPVHQITAATVREYGRDPLQQKTKTKNFRIPESKWNRVQEIAAQAGISASRMLNRIIDHYLGESHDEPRTSNHPGATSQDEELENRESEEEGESPDHQSPSPLQTHTESDDTRTQGEITESGDLPQNNQGLGIEGDAMKTKLYFKSDRAEKEKAAGETIRKMAQEYRANPLKVERQADTKTAHRCCECSETQNLIGCFYRFNKTGVPNFHYCREHIQDTKYCAKCGRFDENCVCDF